MTQKKLTFTDCIILAFSTMVGWGWIMLAAGWADTAGLAGAIIAFLIGMVLCIFIGITYSELTVLFPKSGGEMVFAGEAIGRRASWFTGWFVTLAYLGVAAWEGPALATAIDYLIGIPRFVYCYTINGFDIYLSWILVVVLASLIMIGINLAGVKFSSAFQRFSTVILVLGGIFFLIVSVTMGDFKNIEAPLIKPSGTFQVLLAVPAMYVGFDVIPQLSEDMSIPKKKVPLAILGAIVMAGLWYIAMIFAVTVACPLNYSTAQGIPVADAFSYVFGSVWAGKLLIFCAIFGILTSWNGFLIGASKVLSAMGENHMLPPVFGSKGKNGANKVSIIIVGVLCIGCSLLGKNSLVWFVDASSFGTVLTYLMVAISFFLIGLRKGFHSVYSVRFSRFVAIASILIAVFYISLYLPIGASSLTVEEWILTLAWLGAGLVFYIFYGRRKSSNNH